MTFTSFQLLFLIFLPEANLQYVFIFMQRILLKALPGLHVGELNYALFWYWKSISHQHDSCILYLLHITSVGNITFTNGLLPYSRAHSWLELQVRETKVLCSSARFWYFAFATWCPASSLAGASETCFFKHRLRWWWHRADYKGPLGRKLLPEQSGVLPAVSLTRLRFIKGNRTILFSSQPFPSDTETSD